jgi:diazepam-binding inhibitor (GABA receptor modulating acyl-CoA-binding protein)
MNFKACVATADALPTQDRVTQLALYGLYKQVNTGDAYGARPSFTQMRARAKWDAWKRHATKSKALAEYQYVELVTKLVAALDARQFDALVAAIGDVAIARLWQR